MQLILIFITAVVLAVTGACGGSGNPSAQPEGGSNDAYDLSSSKVSFVSFGDWGTCGDEQKEVAQAIGNYCAAHDCEFILTLGDNFQTDGVSSVDDERWQDCYHDVYDFLGLPFYAALGNHDHKGNIQAEIDYSSIDSNWHMPARDYSFVMPEGSPLVEFFIFDSQYPHFRYDGDDEEEDGFDAPTWLYEAVTSSTATWKILAMHHPFYSNGNHGDDTEDNIPIMLGEYGNGKPNILCDSGQFRFAAVLSGHSHSFSHISTGEDGCTVNQLVIGTGGAGLKGVDDDPRALSTGSFHGFGWFEVTSGRILFRMITKEGDVFYETSWEKE